MKNFLISGIVAAGLFLPLSPAQAAEYPIRVTIQFDGDAAAQLRAVGENAEVIAHFYGEPVDINDPELTDAHHFLSREVIAVYPRNQTIVVGGSLVGAPFERTVNQFIGIRVMRSSYSGAEGVLDCDYAEMPLTEAVEKSIRIACRVDDPFRMVDEPENDDAE